MTGHAGTAAYNFAHLDEQTKRMIRRAILKGFAIPGYQVPFASREMPMPYGWGTGGVQVTAACLTPDDRLKVIDQGADDTTNAVSIRKFFQRTAGIAVTEATADATLIQTRHRIPETPLRAGQILVFQVPIPEPLRFLEPRETETRKMHEHEEYGLMHVKLYEDIAQHGQIATSYAYPVQVEGRYVIDPSPIPSSTTRNCRTVLRSSCSVQGASSASMRCRTIPASSALISPTIPLSRPKRRTTAICAGPGPAIWSRSSPMTGAAGGMSVPTPTIAAVAAARATSGVLRLRAGWRDGGGPAHRGRRPASGRAGPDPPLRRAHRLRRRQF